LVSSIDSTRSFTLLISPADAVNSAVMALWPSGKRFRWVVVVAVSAVLVYWLAVHRRLLQASSQNVAWHAMHRNKLKLSQTIYAVPLAWQVSPENPHFAFLMSIRWFRNPTMVSLEDGIENVPFENALASERVFFANNGKLTGERRVRNGFEEDFCFEGTLKDLNGSFVVQCVGPSGTVSLFSGDREFVDSYYKIVKSARRP
jgi:hypothetical protein